MATNKTVVVQLCHPRTYSCVHALGVGTKDLECTGMRV
jgi:hypothetical protein